jgi:predicted DsbA family dithiol-disulfide isomerase
MVMTVPIRIDFVSDIVCPWCAIGLRALEEAMQRVGDAVAVELHFQPFELNPDMPAAGENIDAHLMRKYGINAVEVARNREQIRQRGEALGFEFRIRPDGRIYNTFDAHRLLHWAGVEGKQHALKLALLRCYFSDGGNPADHATLIAVVEAVGLDAQRARQILDSDTYTAEVRERQRFYASHGISAVPSVIFNERQLIQGGQPVAAFEQALRQLAADALQSGGVVDPA